MLKKPVRILALLSLLLTLSVVGCSGDSDSDAPAAAKPALDIDVSAYVLESEPEGAEEVIAVRAESRQDDEVVIVGRIGGSKDPWIADRAAFTIVDSSLLACSDREGDDCPIPWDYCCETDKLPTSTAFVKFVDADGQLLTAGARDLFALKELQSVVIRGKAQRDEAGNLTILADGMYIRN